ncbi:hypothetical protein Q7P35_000065 [Cladosporium inversicolor]
MDLLVTLSALLLALGTACVHVNGPATAVPISESFLYTTPAMYLWLEVKQVEFLGNLSSDGTQLLGPITAGQLASEPGFELQFNGSVRISGVDHASAKAVEVFTSDQNLNHSITYGYSYSVWTPTFYGGSAKYSVLQNSVLVASETVASSEKPGYFLVGMKINPHNTVAYPVYVAGNIDNDKSNTPLLSRISGINYAWSKSTEAFISDHVGRRGNMLDWQLRRNRLAIELHCFATQIPVSRSPSSLHALNTTDSSNARTASFPRIVPSIVCSIRLDRFSACSQSPLVATSTSEQQKSAPRHCRARDQQDNTLFFDSRYNMAHRTALGDAAHPMVSREKFPDDVEYDTVFLQPASYQSIDSLDSIEDVTTMATRKGSSECQ